MPYCGAAPVPSEIWLRWNLDPVLLTVLAAATGLLAYRSSQHGHHRAGLAASLILLLLIFVSPLCALSSALFSVRVAHHLLLATVVAPLLIWSMPPPRRRFGRLPLWTAVQAIIFWLWHAPPVYAAALSSDAVYWLLQVALLGSAMQFWDAIRRAPAMASALALILSMVQMGLLGAILTFAPSPLFAPHFLSTAAWGLSPLEDQQLSGLLMWVPAAGVYLAAALALLARSLKDSDTPASVPG